MRSISVDSLKAIFNVEVVRCAADGNVVEKKALMYVAWHMVGKGTMICEAEKTTATSSISTSGIDTEIYTPEVMREILCGISQKQFDSLIQTYGDNLAETLSQDDEMAVGELKKCPGIGPKTAEKILNAWTVNLQKSSGNLLSGRKEHYVSDLTDWVPAAPCEWSENVRCYLPQFHRAEVLVSKCVNKKASLMENVSSKRLQKIKQWIDMNQVSTNVVLSKGQRAAIEMASDASILVITGGPGCGKTTVLQYIVKLWCAQGKIVHICAPTGRAAQRIGAIQNVEPSTIHRLLKYRPKGSSNVIEGLIDSVDEDEIDLGEMDSFELGPSNLLESDAVLVDEASMLSLPLSAALMQALKTKTQLILVGDVDQLPPVGPGGILESLISSGMVPVINLREIFRQEVTSTIVTSALAVRNGQYPPVSSEQKSESNNLFNGNASLRGAHIVRSSGDLISTVEQTVRAMTSRDGLELGDLQIISPMRKGPFGVSALNPRLQAILNPPGLAKLEVFRGDTCFRLGDRVLQLHNDYDKDVYNGDQGAIVDIDPVSNKVTVQFMKGFGGQNQLLDYSVRELCV